MKNFKYAESLFFSLPTEKIINLYEGGFVGPIRREDDDLGIIVLNEVTFYGLAALLMTFNSTIEIDKRISDWARKYTTVGTKEVIEINQAVFEFGNAILRNQGGLKQ